LTTYHQKFDRLDYHITNWMARYGIISLRISLGLIFFWFGFLKFFPGLSPAQSIATATISRLTFDLIPPHVSLWILALWESVIGLGLIIGKGLRIILFLLFVQMLGTITPVFLFPGEVFSHIPYAPTLEGQYIIKNLILISSALVIGSTVRNK
jgi:uncharacterized membrane protein YphA (DoxX/SURF4 family)